MINIQNKINYQNFEIVERKGVGHPDTLCDAIAEKISQSYSLYCMKHYRKVAHHWFDKVMLIGGEAKIEYSQSHIIKPYKLIIAGKCAKEIMGDPVPLMDIYKEAAKYVLENNLTDFDMEKHLIIIDETVDHQGAGRDNNRYRPQTLDDLSGLSVEDSRSNDCNLLSSHYPLTTLEDMVLQSEMFLNSKEFKKRFPMIGWDVKVVGYRAMDTYEITINIPVLANYIESKDSYFEVLDFVRTDLESFLSSKYESSVELIINPQDKTGNPYLTLFGSAADTGDVGVVGRGNRINGLITPMQAMSIEAAAGKNPIDHTGKLYSVLAEKLAKKIYELTQRKTDIYIYTYKEVLLNEPAEVIVYIEDENKLSEDTENQIKSLVGNELTQLDEILNDFIFRGVVLW